MSSKHNYIEGKHRVSSKHKYIEDKHRVSSKHKYIEGRHRVSSKHKYIESMHRVSSKHKYVEGKRVQINYYCYFVSFELWKIFFQGLLARITKKIKLRFSKTLGLG